ncbi:hypothetical protein [Dyella agri]|uniref:Uncharacterized protein n=1 Tax=Dyella agri TaxID=1926869 RepID=A0ABW8KJH7_9GAMM
MQAATMQDQATGHARTIPLARAQRPDADALLPYLRRIGATRWHTCFGPLANEPERLPGLPIHHDATTAQIRRASGSLAGRFAGKPA